MNRRQWQTLTSSTWTSRSFEPYVGTASAPPFTANLAPPCTCFDSLAVAPDILLYFFKVFKLDVARAQLVLLTRLHDDPDGTLLPYVTGE